MTNNPTIDGVSRCKKCRGSGWIDNLRSVGATAAKCPDCAPAVERQEPDMCKKCGGVGFLPGTQNCHRCHGSGSEPVDVAALQSTIAQLQARIGELEIGRGEPVARLGVHQVLGAIHNVPGFPGVKGNHIYDLTALLNVVLADAEQPDPVAVVLPDRMEIPDQATFNGGNAYYAKRFDEARSWNACLDATAALNTIHVGELDPAERLALARGEPK